MAGRLCRDRGSKAVERFAAAAMIAAIVLGFTPAVSGLLTSDQMQTLNQYAEGAVRYFTSAQANNLEVGFTHAFFGTGKFQVYKAGQWREEAWDLTRGYGSHVNINEVTLRFVALAVAYRMGWLDSLPVDARYAASWGQILIGLQTLRYLQTSGDPRQYKDGHFHRNYLTTIARDGHYDLDRHVEEIICPEGEDIQSSDDNALPFMNLLVLEGLAGDSTVDIPDRAAIVELCQSIRDAIDLRAFVVGDSIAHAIVDGFPSAAKWDRLSAEGAIILTALLLSDQISEDEFETIYEGLSNYPVEWDSFTSGVISIDKPSYHAAMFIHGLRAIHGVPVTDVESSGLDYFGTSTEPIFEAHADYARHHDYDALGTQVMTQSLYGTPLFEMNGRQVQFPGNEDNSRPVPGTSLSRATGAHAWFIPLQRASQLAQEDIDQLFAWMAGYEDEFFHCGSDVELGWEAAIPWTPDGRTYGWEASDGTWRYTDWGRPFEALNSAYTLLSIYDALNPNARLASCSVEAEQLKRIAFYLDNGVWPSPSSTAAVFRVDVAGDLLADGSFSGDGFVVGCADIAEWVTVSEPVEPGDVLELDPTVPGAYRKPRSSCSSYVAGVVSTTPGVILGSPATDHPSLITGFPSPVTDRSSRITGPPLTTTPYSLPTGHPSPRITGPPPPTTHHTLPTESALLALVGIVPVHACDEGGPIRPGDLLVTASRPGYVRKGDPEECAFIVGKALEPLIESEGLILVLLMR